MKTLILLSKQFPFGNKEQYIAHELGYLAKAFDRVYIYPSDHFKHNDTVCFELPANVEVIDLNASLVSCAKGRVMRQFTAEFLREFIAYPRRLDLIKHWRRYLAIFATQYTTGETLLQFLKSKGIKTEDAIFYSYWMSASALSLSILKQRKAIPGYVVRAHSLDLYHEHWGLLENLEIPPFRCFKQRMADRIYCISKHGADFLASIGVDSKKLHVGYLGVDDFGPNPERSTEPFTIVTCSGADANKRIHLLGAALSRIDLPVRWIHFGDGDLRQQALDSVTSANVLFDYRGSTPNREIREFYLKQHVDLFVMLSKVEGLPVSMMEAISHSIPLIGTAVNGVPEIVIEQHDGRLLPVDFSNDEIDRVLCEVISESGNHAAWRNNARVLFEQKFSAAKNYTAFANELAGLSFNR
jgi:glycosyltransferase involved in cell wall biosynthesis